jgi:predicted ATPase
MASRRNKPINLPAPYLKRIWLDPSRIANREAYPFCLPLLKDDFELGFDRAITILVGENGTGKSTLLRHCRARWIQRSRGRQGLYDRRPFGRA